jgi:GrpB-like predicted nucleotidyltransferase (UPF0157 family)
MPGVSHQAPPTVRIIEVVAYSSEWAANFVAESSRIRDVFGTRALTIEHIGSTAVVGLAAKPVVDILVVLDSTADIGAFGPGMEHVGYTVRGECLDAEIPGSVGRFYYSKDVAGHRTHQVHACASGHPEILDLLVLRDFLRAHPSAAQEYARVKVESAAQSREGSVGYMRAKANTVRILLANARRWAQV